MHLAAGTDALSERFLSVESSGIWRSVTLLLCAVAEKRQSSCYILKVRTRTLCKQAKKRHDELSPLLNFGILIVSIDGCTRQSSDFGTRLASSSLQAFKTSRMVTSAAKLTSAKRIWTSRVIDVYNFFSENLLLIIGISCWSKLMASVRLIDWPSARVTRCIRAFCLEATETLESWWYVTASGYSCLRLFEFVTF